MRTVGRAAAMLLTAALVSTACSTSSTKGVALVASPKSSGGATRIWSFSDAMLVQPAATYAQVLAEERSQLCLTAEAGSKAVTLDQALSTLQGVLDRAAPGALDRLAKTKAGGDAKQAEAVAVAEIGKANPGGALAALLVAHRVEPQQPLHLENAGVVAVSIGYPQEALALFTAAEQLPATLDPGMGIDRTATMENNRAYALVRLGRYAEAVTLLRTAIGREPLLDEAQRNLAVALTCLGQMSEAGSAYRSGLRRNRLHDLGDPNKPTGYDPSQVFDLSHGQPTKLPDVTYPQTLDQAAGAAAKFDSDAQARSAQSRDLLKEVTSISYQSTGRSPLTTLRTSRIEQLAGDIQATPAIAQAYEQWQASYKAMSDADQKWVSDGAAEAEACSSSPQEGQCWNTWCAANLPAAHSSWLKEAKAADKALRAWADAYSRFTSGLASNLKDPAAHQWVLLESQFWLTANYALQIGNANVWIGGVAGFKGSCYDQVTDAPAETKDGGKTSAPDCSAVLGGLNISIDFEVFALSISCEEVSVEAELPDAEGGIAEAGEFVSIGHKFGGSTTVFAGGYAKTREINGLSAGAKGGLYVTWDSQGNVSDIGARAEGSIDQEGEGTSASSSLAGKDVSWSFVGSADPGEG